MRRIETHQQLLGEPVSQWQNCNARGKTPLESTTIARPRTIESPDPKNHQMDLQTMDVSRPRKFCLDFCQEFEAWQYWQNTVCVTAGGGRASKLECWDGAHICMSLHAVATICKCCIRPFFRRPINSPSRIGAASSCKSCCVAS